MTDPMQLRFLTIQQVAEELNVSAAQVYSLLRRGHLIGIQIGGRSQWRVERVRLEQYIDLAYRRTAAGLCEKDELDE